MSVLIVRPDRIGDVVLSTPVFQAFFDAYPQVQMTVLVRKEVIPLLCGLPGLSSLDSFIVYSPEGEHQGWMGFWRLYQQVLKRKFKKVIVLKSEWKLALIFWLARISVRVGPLSSFSSFLFFNYGLRQKRSEVKMHEVDYNLKLLEKVGIFISERSLFPRVFLNPSVRQLASEWLLSQGWFDGGDTKKGVLVHPGMGGSALNWSESHYVQLIQSLIMEGVHVLVTGGPLEGPLLDRIAKRLKLGSQVQKKQIFFYSSSGDTFRSTLDFWAALSSLMDCVIAPSTGPLHVAAALGVPVLSFYPPIRVQSEKRWGPYSIKARVLSPPQNIVCGQVYHCLGDACSYFLCMNKIEVEEAMVHLRRVLSL